MDNRQKIIDKIIETQGDNGFWKVLPKTHKYFPDYIHYVPNFKATLWTLILLADLGCDRNDQRIKRSLQKIQNHFYDPEFGIFTLKEVNVICYPFPFDHIRPRLKCW